VNPLATVFRVLKLLKPLVGCNLWFLELGWDMDHTLVQSAEDLTGG
jgi:opacity protein-like surface antigen